MSVAIEGAINDIGESHLGTWAWKRLEKAETALKWFVVSRFISDVGFLPDCEPIQTVQDLKRLRDKIAHPKSAQVDDDWIIRLSDGTIVELVPKTESGSSLVPNAQSGQDLGSDTLDALKSLTLNDGDLIFRGYGRHRTEFGADAATKAVQRGYSALKKLSDQSTLLKLAWLGPLKDEFSWLGQACE